MRFAMTGRSAAGRSVGDERGHLHALRVVMDHALDECHVRVGVGAPSTAAASSDVNSRGDLARRAQLHDAGCVVGVVGPGRAAHERKPDGGDDRDRPNGTHRRLHSSIDNTTILRRL